MYLITGFLSWLGMNGAAAAPEGCSLPPPPAPPLPSSPPSLWLTAIYLCQSSTLPPFSPTPRACARRALNWCLALTLSDGKTNDFSLASLHLHTERRGGRPTERRARTAQHSTARRSAGIHRWRESSNVWLLFPRPLIKASFYRA